MRWCCIILSSAIFGRCKNTILRLKPVNLELGGKKKNSSIYRGSSEIQGLCETEAECKEAQGEVQCFRACRLITHEWCADLHFPAHCSTSHLITPFQVQSFERFPGVSWASWAARGRANKKTCRVLCAHSAQRGHVIIQDLVRLKSKLSSITYTPAVFAHTVCVILSVSIIVPNMTHSGSVCI